MKRSQILVIVVAVLAVGLAGYAVGASRQATDIAVESQLANEDMGQELASEDTGQELASELAAEEEPSAVEDSAVDYTEDGWMPENNFYQSKKVHIDWDLGDPDPWD